MYECCGRTFEARALRQHLDNSYAHANEIGCRWCFARWPTHHGKLRLAHEQKKHWYRCDDCTWSFSTKEGLQEHIDEEHPPNYCYGCQRSFKNPNNLDQVTLALRPTHIVLKRLPLAPQIIHPRRQKRQMSLVPQQIHKPNRRLPAPRIRQLHIRHQPHQNQPILPRSRPEPHLYQQAHRMVRRKSRKRSHRRPGIVGRFMLPVLLLPPGLQQIGELEPASCQSRARGTHLSLPEVQ